jgi:hypothetical protein
MGSHSSVLGRKARFVVLCVGLVTAMLAIGAAPAGAAINGTNDAGALAGAMAGSPSPVSGASVITPNYPGGNGVYPNAVSDTPLAGFPTNGSSYTILTTGNSAIAGNANNSTGSSSSNGAPGTGALQGANDYTILSVPITATASARCVGFDFRFLSEEFPEYVGKGFNDTFLAELDSRTWAVQNQTVTSQTDFAAGTGDRISVDASGPSAMSAENAAGTTYDGATTALTARKYVTPGSHTVIFSIFDLGDSALDTAAFIDNLRVTSEPQCHSLGLDAFEGLTGIDAKKNVVLCKSFDCAKFQITCNLPGGSPIPCSPFILVIANFQTGELGRATGVATISKKGRKKVKLTKSKQVTIPPATTKTVKLKLKPKAKKALKAAQKAGKKKVAAKIKVTNPANGSKSTIKVKLKLPKKH